jgi:hypothetical protein
VSQSPQAFGHRDPAHHWQAWLAGWRSLQQISCRLRIECAVLALRDALRQAEALGMPHAQVLDILELGAFGGLVARKRRFLTGKPMPAEFTLGALAKDMALLAAASNRSLRASRTNWPRSLLCPMPTSLSRP